MTEKVDPRLLRASAVGEDLSDEECQILAGIMEARRLRDGERLVAEGQADNTLFILIDGRLAVTGNVLGQEIVVYTMKKGEVAGTRAFVDRTPRKATLRAAGDATVYCMKPDAFESLLGKQPHIVYGVMRALFRITHSNLMRMNQESQELVNYVSKVRGRY